MLRDKIRESLAPFQHKNFRILYLFQLLSQMGRWSHDLARSWLILSIDPKASTLGLLFIIMAIPNGLLLLPAGVLVDKIDIKKIILTTKSLQAISAFSLFFMVFFDMHTLYILFAFAFVDSAIAAFDAPSYSSLTVRLVPKKDFKQALLFNTTNFHLGRALGPLVAGLCMKFYGASIAFFIDGVTYLAIVLILIPMALLEIKRDSNTGKKSITLLFDGLIHLFTQPKLKYYIAQLYLTIFCIFPVAIVVNRAFIKNKFNVTGEDFGFIFSITALGAALGALSFSFLNIRKPISALKFGVPMVALSFLIYPTLGNLSAIIPIIFVNSLFSYICFASLTVSLHFSIQEEYRGRMASVTSFGFLSFGPLICLPVGYMADKIGYQPTIQLMAVIFVVFSGGLAYLHHGKLKKN